MAAASIITKRTFISFLRYYGITKNARCVQCSLSYLQLPSLTAHTFATHLAPHISFGIHKNVCVSNMVICRLACSSTKPKSDDPLNLSEESCPQGVQGDDCSTFKLWLDNCQRYGLQNCNEQLQGIQTGRKTLGEVMAEQDKLIAEIAEQYRASYAKDVGQGSSHLSDRDSIQGCQDNVSAFPEMDIPCPQGVQGSDCARFKLWLENCHRFGFSNCSEQYKNYQEGRKTLAEIFQEQDKIIRDAASTLTLTNRKNTRSYSTLTGQDKTKGDAKDSETGQLSQKQKLKRAVKEYGSTVVIFHVSISLMSLGFFYLLVSSGIDVVGIMKSMGVGGTLLESKLAAGTGTFVVAYAVHKVFAPVRIATTLTATPLIVRYLRRIGVLRAPTPPQQKS